MSIQKKPYLIIPMLIEQPTWGGEYICEKKGWLRKQGIEGKKIGQSYELYSKSCLATTITSSLDPLFSPETKDTIPISSFTEGKPFPLIKFTQAKGNSFQLHIKPGIKDPLWRPKAESWYFFEEGIITFGIKKGTDINIYKETCFSIDDTMKKLSEMIIKKSLTFMQAQQEATVYIQEKNPWQYVNMHTVKSEDVVDLSGGGLHHSWEENIKNLPQGNILYEVQQDEMDPTSTIRSFDRGKFLDDGTVRATQIDAYFKYLDTDEERNTLKTQQKNSAILFATPHYSLKKLEIEKKLEMKTETSFHHIFVKKGSTSLRSEGGELFVSEGHSCFIPQGVPYTIEVSEKSTLLQTSLE
ncbi:MAG: hypothetical protein V1922_04480 [bacterium]